MRLETKQEIRERHWEAGRLRWKGSVICIRKRYFFKKLTLNMDFHSMHTLWIFLSQEIMKANERFIWVKNVLSYNNLLTVLQLFI